MNIGFGPNDVTKCVSGGYSGGSDLWLASAILVRFMILYYIWHTPFTKIIYSHGAYDVTNREI